MAKSNQDHFNKQLRTDAGDLAVHVAEFTRHLSGLGHTRRTTNDYGHSASHFAIRGLPLVAIRQRGRP